MRLFIKCIMFSVWMWFIVRFSEKPSGRRKIWIDNRFLYVFTWLWHSYGEISIMGLMYAIGVQVVDIIGVVFYLLMPLNREIICIYWLKFLLGVLFWAAGIGIFDMAKNAEEKTVYENYYDFSTVLSKVSGYQTLAINRGEKEKILTVKIEAPEDDILRYLRKKVIVKENEYTTPYLEEMIADSYKRLIAPAIEREIRNELTETAEDGAIW